ncbi:MAG: Uma2 family endonuclease [Armatimonadetes bacterium]|nr:Uma2 family endonuclease [Armatimonadota bacterium]
MPIKEPTSKRTTRKLPARLGTNRLRAPRQAATRTPRLENGDRLTRQEFERRYETMPTLKKAELIEGVVHMPSPVRLEKHAQPHGNVMGWLAVYVAETPGVYLADNATVRLDAENEFQPDALLRLEHALGGSALVTSDDYLEGPPELIVEIAPSSVSIDLHDKLRVYRRNEVQEYLVWQVEDRRIDWFALKEGEYVPLLADESGILHSQVFPGLHLDVNALFQGDMARVLAVLQKGIASKEHASFAQRLSSKKRKGT